MQELRTDHQVFDERFQAFERRSHGDMYDVMTQLQALRMQLATPSTIGPSQEVRDFEAQRQEQRQAHLVYSRRGGRRSSPRADPPEGQ